MYHELNTHHTKGQDMYLLDAVAISSIVAVLALLVTAYLVGRRHGYRNAMDETLDTRVFAEHIVAELEAVGDGPDVFTTAWLRHMTSQVIAWRKDQERQFPWPETPMAIATPVVQSDLNSSYPTFSDEPTANETSKSDSGEPTMQGSAHGKHASAETVNAGGGIAQERSDTGYFVYDWTQQRPAPGTQYMP